MSSSYSSRSVEIRPLTVAGSAPTEKKSNLIDSGRCSPTLLTLNPNLFLFGQSLRASGSDRKWRAASITCIHQPGAAAQHAVITQETLRGTRLASLVFLKSPFERGELLKSAPPNDLGVKGN